MAKKTPERVDVLVAGGGYVGLSCAVAIKHSAPHLDVLIVDPAPETAIENDERSSAIAADASGLAGHHHAPKGTEEQSSGCGYRHKHGPVVVLL